MYTVNVDSSTSMIFIGHRGENEATQVLIDVSDLISTYGSGTAILYLKRPRASYLVSDEDDPAYPVTSSLSGSTLTWLPNSTDTLYAGDGKLEVFWYVGDLLAKSVVFPLRIYNDVGAQSATPPDQYTNWLDSLTALAAQVQADAADVADAIDKIAAHDTASGSVVAITDGADGLAVRDLIVNIEPQQASGTPSPSNILPITGWSSANIKHYKKNLFDASDVVETSGHETYCYIDDGYLIFLTSPAASYGIYWDQLDIPCPLIFHGSVKNFDSSNTNNIKIYFTYDDGTSEYLLVSSIAAETEVSFSQVIGSAGKRLIRITNANTSGRYAGFNLSTTQLEYGTTATDFEAYTTPTTYTIDLDGTIYGGQLDVTTGVLTVDRAIVDLGTLNWTQRNDYSQIFSASASSLGVVAVKGTVSLVCSAYTAVADTDGWGSVAQYADGSVCIKIQTSYNQIAIVDSSYSDATTFATAMSGVQLCYELATPYTVQLSPTEVTTLLGNNTIYADTGSVELLDYHADTTLYIAKLTGSTDTDMIADSNIASGKYFMIGGNLYKSTTAITAGETIAVGTNCTKTDLATALNALQ